VTEQEKKSKGNKGKKQTQGGGSENFQKRRALEQKKEIKTGPKEEEL